MVDFDAVTLGQPILRWSDVNENSTRWDKLVAAPDDDTLVIMWWGFVAVSVLAAVVTLTVSLGILYSPSTRRSSFNIYLVFLLMPDFFLSFSCIFTCWMSARKGHFTSTGVCRYESFYVMFAIGASAWTNLNIMKEVYKMLRFSHRRKRYFAPTMRQVCKEEFIIYAFCSLIAIIGILPQSNFPLRTYPQTGYACVPIEYDIPSSLFFNLVYFQALAGLPMTYVVFVNADVLYRQLLPNDKRVRQFAIYFLRVVVIFFVWWLPAILFIFMVSGTKPWFKWFWSTWVHWQGIASAAMCMMKPDVYGSTKAMLTLSRYVPQDLSSKKSKKKKNKKNKQQPDRIPARTNSTVPDGASVPLSVASGDDPVDQQQPQSQQTPGPHRNMEEEYNVFGDDDDDDDENHAQQGNNNNHNSGDNRTITEEFNVFASSALHGSSGVDSSSLTTGLNPKRSMVAFSSNPQPTNDGEDDESMKNMSMELFKRLAKNESRGTNAASSDDDNDVEKPPATR